MESVGTVGEVNACVDAVVLASSHIFPTVLNAAVQLDLFGIIAKEGPGGFVSATEIASQLPTQNLEASSMIDRMLRLFASHSLLSHSHRTLEDGRVERVYGLTPTSKFFVKGGDNFDDCLSPTLALAHHPVNTEVRLHMKSAILEGGSLFKRVHGMSIFEYMNKDPEYNTVFNEAMAAFSTVIMNAALEVYTGFEGLTSLVDVGGGTGRTLNMIISKYPSIKGINYDLPHVVQSAPQYPGIQHVGGDMFTGVPRGEGIMIKDTCQNWNDENVVKVFKNIYAELPNGGKLIIINAILPEEPETTKMSQFVSALDNAMLAQPAGKERTAQEFKALTEAADFKNFRVACVAHAIWAVMESFK